MADIASLFILAAGAAHEAGVVHEAGAAHGVEPSALGLGPGAWVALSMAVLLGIALYLKVPRAFAAGLDKGIAEIKRQLDEAKALRTEAEALRQEYADKIASAEQESAAMIEHARHEAEVIVAKAAADTVDLIARREKMASDRIAAAELAAVQELRAKTAEVAATAAGTLIKAKHDASADKALVDQAIAGF